MLPRRRRLHRQEDIIRVVRTGQKIITPYIIIHYLPADKVSRIACVVGKKVSLSAVARHRYQRWLREIVKAVSPSMKSRAYDMVWVGRPTLVKVDTLGTLKDSVLPHLQPLIS